MSGSKVARTVVVLLAPLMGAVACASDANGPNGGTPSISLAVSPDSVAISQGGSGQVTAMILRSGGFGALVTLAVQGAPPGVTVSVSNLATSGTTTRGTVTVRGEQDVTPGTFTLLLRARGPGVPDAWIPVVLTVGSW